MPLSELQGYVRRLALEEGGIMSEWDPEKEELRWDGVQVAPAREIRKEERASRRLPAITAGKIIKQKVFPVSIPPSNSRPPSTTIGLLWTRCRLKDRLPS